jgi:hypothetical protein
MSDQRSLKGQSPYTSKYDAIRDFLCLVAVLASLATMVGAM